MKLGVEVAAALVLIGASAPALYAHEFWIDGTVVVEDGEAMLGLDLKVGQTLDGISLPYIPETVDSFAWVHGGTGEITGRIGDIPAARVPLDASESVVILHRTQPRRLVHNDWTKFLEYLALEGLDGIADEHDRRDLPQEGFTETYTRHAKFALVTPGQPIHDRYVGSPAEIVLDCVSQSGDRLEIAGRLVADGEPRAHQISAFYQSPDKTETLRRRAQRDGSFTFTVPVGPVLLNAVSIMPVTQSDVAWHSDWASLFVEINQTATARHTVDPNRRTCTPIAASRGPNAKQMKAFQRTRPAGDGSVQSRKRVRLSDPTASGSSGR